MSHTVYVAINCYIDNIGSCTAIQVYKTKM